MGAIKAEGIKNQLGRPTLDRLTVLVREAAQNSWDAADDGFDGPVAFSLDLRQLDEEGIAAWSRALLSDAPADENLALRHELGSSPVSILFVSDRGTDGLGGPTRADAATAEEPHDYVSFVLNVGDPRDTELGGGTYGFGKAVFFSASTASTILVHTRCRNEEGAVESRLIGCALGNSFENRGHAYTGRHWFGLPADHSDVVEPVRGEDADNLARELGFPAFGDAELGTTIAVVALDHEGRDAVAAAEWLANSILWHLWPKMITGSNGAPTMTFSVSLNDAPVEIGDPALHPVLGEFAAALRDLETAGDTITYGAQQEPIGRILLGTTYAPPPVIDLVGQEAGFRLGVRHCCLLRAPELVVEYREGPAFPDDRVWYAGVFKVFAEYDETFAQSEPPTHDAWSPNYLDDRDRSLVKVTLRKIDDKLRSHAAPRVVQTAAGGGEGLAALSRMLGSLIVPAPGEGAGAVTRKPAPGQARRTVVKTLGDPQWGRFDERDVLVQAFEVDAKRQLTLDAETTVRVWGGGEKKNERPVGALEPELLAWRDPSGQIHRSGRLAISPSEGGRWEAIVAPSPDTVTRIRVHEATSELSDG
jgi:hypothetical protein